MKFEHNFTCFSWLLDFISSTEQRRNQIMQLDKKDSLVTISSQIKTARRKKFASTAITTTFTTTVVNTNVQLQFQLVNTRPFITLPTKINPSRKPMW